MSQPAVNAGLDAYERDDHARLTFTQQTQQLRKVVTKGYSEVRTPITRLKAALFLRIRPSWLLRLQQFVVEAVDVFGVRKEIARDGDVRNCVA